MIYIDKNLNIPLYEQIYNCIKDEIATGVAAAFSRLPSTRQLASSLGVSRNTVDNAFQQLVAEGAISSRVGYGYVVNPITNQIYEDSKLRTMSGNRYNFTNDSIEYDFSPALLLPESFPYKDWKKTLSNVMSMLDSQKYIPFPERTGFFPLRKILSKFLFKSRGVRCEPGQIMIGCGIQYNLDMLLKIFDPLTCIAGMEEPGYSGIRGVFEANRFHLIPIPEGVDGIDIGYLKNLNLHLLFLAPSHQFPTGNTLSLPKRMEVLKWAAENDTYIIEDDYDSELQYTASPIPSLQSLDYHNRVIYTGTFSKSLSPNLRISYMVIPPQLCSHYMDVSNEYLCPVPLLNQYVVSEFIWNGCYLKHLNKLRNCYGKKHDAFLAALHGIFGNTARVYGTNMGLHFLVDLDTSLDQKQLVQSALEKKCKVYPVSAYYMQKDIAPPHQILLGYGGIKIADYPKALIRLYEAYFGK